MNEKARPIVIVVAVVLIAIGVFFAGRTTGRGRLQERVSQTQELLDQALGERDRLLALSRELLGHIDELGSELNGFEAKLDQFNESIQAGIQRIKGSISRNQELYLEYVERVGELDDYGRELGAIIDEGNEFIKSVDEATPKRDP